MDGYDGVLTEEYISEEYDGFQAMQDFGLEIREGVRVTIEFS